MLIHATEAASSASLVTGIELLRQFSRRTAKHVTLPNALPALEVRNGRWRCA
jgi:hypothetical protein